ncbi:MAG: DNA translocase FtsK 4TM domain-containing protein, partial [Clostridia bacterium]|nr:DNA translocase FtsK 4TM domain-containing protein [Clostridia bacterium]
MAITIVTLLVLSVLMLIGFFAKEAAVLRLICDLVKYLFGAGFFTSPFVLLFVALDLLLHFKRKNNVFRLIVLSTVPFFVGAIAHVFTAPETYASVSAMIKDGLAYKSGGLLAGGAAELLSKAITRLGAGIVLAVVFVLLLLVAVNITLTRLAASAGDKLERAKDKQIEQHKYRRAERERQREIARTQREQMPLPEPPKSKKDIDIPLAQKRSIDIPLDGYSTAPTGAFAAPGETASAAAPEVRQPVAVAAPPVKVAAPRTEPEPLPVRVAEPQEPVATPVKQEVLTKEPEESSDEPIPVYQEAHHTAADDLAVLRVRGVTPPPSVSPDVFQPIVKQPPAEKSARERLRTTMTKDELEDEIAQINGVVETPVAAEYRLPPIELLKTEPQTNLESAEAEMRQNADKLIRTLASFNLDAQIVGVTRGPSVTRYEVQLSSGTRSSRLTGLADDIALALAAQSIRIAPIPNKSAIGIEVPNKIVTMVYLRDVIESREFRESRSQVTFALGNDIAGQPIVSDISR